MNHIERVLAAINHGEVDRVPWGEFWLEKGLVKSLVPGKNQIGFLEEAQAMELLGMDSRALCPKEPKRIDRKPQEGEIIQDIWGRSYQIRRGRKLLYRPALSLDQAHKYVFPRPEEMDYSGFRQWSQKTHFFIFALLDGIFQGVGSLVDFNEFLMATVSHPKPIGDLAEKRAQFLVEQARLCVEAGAHGILIGDDLAYNQGTYISPRVLRELFFPFLQEAVTEIKKLGVPVFLHSDGNLNAILKDLVELGIDGLHSLEAEAGMDLAYIKKTYGERICLMGNLDLATLTGGEPEDVVRLTQEVLAIGAPGSGFILSSASGILGPDVPVANLEAISRTLLGTKDN